MHALIRGCILQLMIWVNFVCQRSLSGTWFGVNRSKNSKLTLTIPTRCVSNYWASARQNQQNGTCAHLLLISAWVSAQSDRSSLCAQWVAKDPSWFSCIFRILYIALQIPQTANIEIQLGCTVVIVRFPKRRVPNNESQKSYLFQSCHTYDDNKKGR